MSRVGEEVSIEQSGDYTLFEYDLLNRMVGVSKIDADTGALKQVVSYRYNHKNLRIERTDDEGTTRYVFDLAGNIIEEYDEERLTRYVFRNNKHLAKITPDGKTYYYGTDNLGSTTVLFDEEGNAVWKGEISAFGNVVLGEWIGEELFDERVRFTGKDYDEVTGLYYFNARWYDPQLGRFTSEDPVRDGMNWYVYVRNNPLRFIDPTGLEFIDTDPSGRQQGDYYDKKHPNRTTKLGASASNIGDAGCYLAAFTRIGNDLRAKQGLEPITLIQSNKLAKNSKLFSGNSGNLLTKDSGRSLVELMSGKIISEVTSVSNNIEETADKYNKSSSEFYGILKTEFNLNGDDGTHFMNLDDFVNEDFLVNDTSRRGRRTSENFRATEKPARLDVYKVTGDGQISSSISSSPDNVSRNDPKTNETGLGK